MNLYPILLGLIAFLSTLSGGLLAARLSSSQLGALTAFAAGVLIAVPLFDLLPEAHEKNPPSLSVVLCLAGFLFIFVLPQWLQV
jgi:zinc transporter ZupT